MTAPRRPWLLLLAALCAPLVTAGSASAQEAPVIVPAVPGVGGAEASPGHSSAWVVDSNGVVVGKSEATPNSSKVTIVGVGGADVLAKEGDTNHGHYTGLAAPAGAGIDAANGALCPEGGPCVQVARSDAYSFSHQGAGASYAHFTLLSASTGGDPATTNGLTVGDTWAVSGRTSSGMCKDAGLSFVLSGVGPVGSVILLNPGGATHGVATSGVPNGVPCPPPPGS